MTGKTMEQYKQTRKKLLYRIFSKIEHGITRNIYINITYSQNIFTITVSCFVDNIQTIH